MNPKISIITITFNSEKTLEETIKSVVEQDYDNLEYLIVDGGSTDRTMEIVNKYREQIDIVLTGPDKGISDAFNKGIKNAKGEIIGIINSDDILLPGALQSIAENYEKGIDVYRGRTVIWNEETEQKVSIEPTMEFPISQRIRQVCHQSTFVTKEAYEKWGGFKLCFRYMMDADLLHRFYNAGAVFKYVNADLAVFRLGGVTNDNWQKKIRERRLLVTENGGSCLLSWYHAIKFAFFQTSKKLIFRLVNPDKARRLYYSPKP